jgi:tetratricopeptide (TPR) repeat protein
MGSILIQQERFAEVLTKLQRDLAPVWATIADIYLDQEEHLKAIVTYRQLIKLDPQNPYPYFHLGQALKGRGRNSEAVESFQQARDLFQQQGKVVEVQETEMMMRELQEPR